MHAADRMPRRSGSTAPRRLLATAVLAGLSALGPPEAGAGTVEVWPDTQLRGAVAADLYDRLREALNSGDADALLALHAENVTIVSMPTCPAQTPCVGRQRLRAVYGSGLLGTHAQVRPLDATIDEAGAWIRSELQNDATRRLGIPRIILSAHVQARSGQIVRLVFEPDPYDADTATYLRSQGAPTAPGRAAAQ